MLLRYRNFESFAYAISEKTSLSQPQAELYINVGLIRGYARENGAYLISDEKIRGIDTERLLQHKPYTVETLAGELGTEPVNINRIISHGILKTPYQSGNIYLFTDAEVEKIKADLPDLLSRAYDAEQMEEDELEKELGEMPESQTATEKPQTEPDGITEKSEPWQELEMSEEPDDQKPKRRARQKKHTSSPAVIHYEKTNGPTETISPGPENSYNKENYGVTPYRDGAAPYRNEHTFERTDTHPEETRYDDGSKYEDRTPQQEKYDNGPSQQERCDNRQGYDDGARYNPNNPQYTQTTASEYDLSRFRQDSDTIKVDSTSQNSHAPEKDIAASEYNPGQFRQDSDTVKADSTSRMDHRAPEGTDTAYHPTDKQDSTVSGSIPYTEKQHRGETDDTAFPGHKEQPPRDTRDKSTVPHNSETEDAIRAVRRDSDTISAEYSQTQDEAVNPVADKTKGMVDPRSVTDSTDAAHHQHSEKTSAKNKEPFYDSGCDTSSWKYHNSHIISYAIEQPVLQYQDIPVAYISRNEEFKEAWMQEAKPVSAETHDPIQMANLYHTLSESPEQIKAGQYTLHLTNGEEIAVTEETIQKTTKSENLPEADGSLVSSEQAAYVDMKGNRTRVYGISDMDEFTTSSTSASERTKPGPYIPSAKGVKTTITGETTPKGEHSPGADDRASSDAKPSPAGPAKKRQVNKKDARRAVLGSDKRSTDSVKGPAGYPSEPQNHAGQEGDVFHIKKKKKMDQSAFAEMGAMAFRQSFSGANAYAGYRTVARYAGWIDPTASRLIKKAEFKAYKVSFKANNKLGNVEHSLRNAGVKTNVLKNKKGKYKRKLSNQEIKYLMNELNTKFMAANIGSVDLGHMNDKELKNLMKTLSGKDKEIVKGYIEMKKMAGLKKELGKLKKRSRRKLLRLFGNVMEGTDFYDGMIVASRYGSLSIRMIEYGARTKRWVQKKAAKIVKPYGRHLDKRAAKKEAKVNARVKRKLQKKRVRQFRRRKKRAERIDRISKRLTGKSAAQLRSSFQSTKVGKGISKVRGKLSPVMKIKRQATGVVSKIFGKTFGIVGKVLSAPRKLAMWALALIAPLFLICVLVTVAAAAVIAAFNVIPEGDSKMPGGETLVANAATVCVDKDNKWYREIRGLEHETTPKEANGGQAVMGGYDPFAGEQHEIAEFSGETVYKYYDGKAFSYISGKEEEVDIKKDDGTIDKEKLKEALKLIPQINLYSNGKAVMSAAAVYRQETDIDNQEYVDFCKQLWDHSHAYQTAIGDVYMCEGCKQANIACYKKAEYNAYTNAYGENYNFLPVISDETAANGCYTFYCNDANSYNTAVHKKGDVAATHDKDDKGCKTKTYNTEYTIYCGFSRHTSDNPGIGDCAGVTENMKENYYVHGFYRDVDAEGCGAHGADYSNCKFAKNFHKGDGITSASLNDVCASYQVILVKNGNTKQEVTYNDHSYWIGYCSNLGDLGAGKNYDGYILVSKSNANLSADGNYVMTPYLSEGKPVWFYECQGHEMKKRVFSWCPGHNGCIGHDVKYCLGHCALEVYASIAGLSEDEVKKEEAKYNILEADNFFFNDGDGAYDSEWGGYEDEHCSWAAMILDNDWEDMYDLPDDTFMIDTNLEENTW